MKIRLRGVRKARNKVFKTGFSHLLKSAEIDVTPLELFLTLFQKQNEN